MYKNFAGNSCSAPYTNMEKVYWLIVCVGGVHLYMSASPKCMYIGLTTFSFSLPIVTQRNKINLLKLPPTNCLLYTIMCGFSSCVFCLLYVYSA